MITFLIYLLIGLLVLALVAYVIKTYVPLDDKVKNLVIGIIALIFLLWLLRVLFWPVAGW
jgi:hypothetical protein